MSELNPKQKELRKAVASYCEKTGVNAATIALVAEKMIGLLAARWDHICDVAIAQDEDNKVSVGFRVSFDMSHKTPVGSVKLSFSQITSDDCDFQVEDPDQPSLPFSQTVRTTPIRPDETVHVMAHERAEGAIVNAEVPAAPTPRRRARRTTATAVAAAALAT